MSERSSSPDPVHGGEGEPAEITRIKRELKSASEETGEAGDWLGSAMEASWGVAEALLKYPEVADLLSERHRIISRVYRALIVDELTPKRRCSFRVRREYRRGG